MNNFSCLGVLPQPLAIGTAQAQPPAGKPVIVKKDPALDELISPDAKLEKIAGGFGFTEGALWVPKGRAAISCSATCPPT